MSSQVRSQADVETSGPHEIARGLELTADSVSRRHALGLAALFASHAQATAPLTSSGIPLVRASQVGSPPGSLLAHLERLERAIQAVRSFSLARRTIEEENASDEQWRAINQIEFDALCDLSHAIPRDLDEAASLSSVIVAYRRATGEPAERGDYVFNALVGLNRFLLSARP